MLRAALITSCWLVGCAGRSEHVVVGTNLAPTVDGVVQIEPIEGGNRLVTVAVDGLVPPRHLGSGLQTYVVWFEATDTIKAGVLAYEESTREGRMFATTMLPSFLLKITAEQDGEVDTPSDVVVLQKRLTHD